MMGRLLSTEHKRAEMGAREEAGAVGHAAADAGRDIAGTAAEQAGQVAGEARRQVEDFTAEVREQIADQARAGQHRTGESLRSLAAELHEMADRSDRPGPVSGMAREAAQRADDIAGWLDRHEPADVVKQVRGLARRRPGMFLAGAALAGVVAGRLTRGAIDSGGDDSPAGPSARPPRKAGRGEDEGRGDDEGHGDDEGPSHAMRPGATTVGEYVEELERRGELDQPPVTTP